MKRVKRYLAAAVTVPMLIGFSIGTVDAKCIDARTVTPAEFNSPQDNVYLPMALGYTYRYEAETEDGLIRNEITATFDTVTILGVTCTVVHDTEWLFVEDLTAWVLIEQTSDWLAWDNDGNVWYFGEDTLEWVYDDNWNFLYTTNAGSWTAGVDGALPGILMLADPTPGTCYQQEYYQGQAEDMGKVIRLDVSVSIESGDYDECLETKEWTPLDPGTIEHKYYAPGVGLVFIEELKGKTVEVELVEIISP